MKQYKYRGWRHMVFITLILLVTEIAVFAAHRNPDVHIAWWFLLVLLPGQLLLLIEQRQLTEAEWRRREAENDERYQIIAGKAALITCAVGDVTLLGAIMYVLLREPENETALFALVAGMLVPMFTFLIAKAILNKRL